MRLFLDSGAFSVWNRGERINLDEYITFCKKYEKDLDAIATLDVIPGSPNRKVTFKDANDAAKEGFLNYEKMLKAKLKTEKLLHTFHQGDPEWALEKLIKEGGPYIGISPANDKTSIQRIQWMNSVCMPQLLNSKGKPKVKFHGFAVTSLKLIYEFPWYSVDSSSWRLIGGGFGKIITPQSMRMLTKEDHYNIQTPIGVGVNSHLKNDAHVGFFEVKKATQSDVSFKSPEYKRQIEELLNSYHFDLKELESDASLRAAWNAIYLMTSINKFSKTILYLATNELKSLEVLIAKMQENNISLDNLNVLISFAMLPRKKNLETLNSLDKLIILKNKYK